MRWVDNIQGRKARKEKELATLIQNEASRIATGAVMEAVKQDRKFRRAFKGITNRAEADRLSDVGRKIREERGVQG